MEITEQAVTGSILANAVEVASGILRALDGNDISSSQDGPRDIENDVAVVLNQRLNVGETAMINTAIQEVNNAS